jgi:hypothetical protein
MYDDAAGMWDFAIPVDFIADGKVYDGIITQFLDADGEQTWRPDRATIAIGEFINGPHAGRPFILDDIDPSEIKVYVH